MKKAVVIYDTKFGNTEKIARALSEGIRKEGLVVDCLKIDAVDPSKLGECDMLAVGAPTQAFRISAPMKEFLRKLENVDLRGKKGFAFDTRLKSRFAGSAANGIEKKLKELGLTIIRDYASAMVGGTEGPLEEKAEKRFEQIGSEIAKM